jgi:N-acetylneuraminate synthase
MWRTTSDGAAYVIAEAGVNHNGSLTAALELVDAASEAHANAVKFQSFTASKLVTRYAPKADYQKRTTDIAESQYEMIRKLELSESDFVELIARARARAIDFLSTPFDSDNLRLLTEKFGLRTIKVSSGDLTNAPLLLDIARQSENVILSTGMSTLAEVEAALSVLAYGFTRPNNLSPGPGDFEAAFISDAGQLQLRNRVTLLHCSAEYPADVKDVNLRAMDTLTAAFGLRTGYSDHTVGIHIPVAAVARGASVIEKHFTLDRSLPGPDHMASLEPAELVQMVRQIREVEASLGSGIKRPSVAELKNRVIARKSLVAAAPIAAGESLQIECKRPGTSLSPFEFWSRVGKASTRNYVLDEPIE